MMHTADMLKAIAPYREDAIVIPGRGGRYWIDLTTRPNLDVPVGDPAMGGHAGFALGLALARPDKRVVLRLRGRHPDEPRHAGHNRRTAAGKFLSLPDRQRRLCHNRWPA